MSQSGYALLHFFSDAAYNLTGFNISYRSEASVFVSSQSSGPSKVFGFDAPRGSKHVPDGQKQLQSDALRLSLSIRAGLFR